jgi:hypothetical protein
MIKSREFTDAIGSISAGVIFVIDSKSLLSGMLLRGDKIGSGFLKHDETLRCLLRVCIVDLKEL